MSDQKNELKERRKEKSRWDSLKRAIDKADETIDDVRKACVGPDCPVPSQNNN